MRETALATRLSGGSARACARKAKAARRQEGKDTPETNAKRRQKSSQKAKAARRHEGKDTPKNQRETEDTDRNYAFRLAVLILCHVLTCGDPAFVDGSEGEVEEMDTLGIEPRASRMLSGCDTTTPCAH